MKTTHALATLIAIMAGFSAHAKDAVTADQVVLQCKINGGKSQTITLEKTAGYTSELLKKTSLYASVNAKTGELSLAQSGGDTGEIAATGPLSQQPLLLTVSVPGLPQESISCTSDYFAPGATAKGCESYAFTALANKLKINKSHISNPDEGVLVGDGVDTIAIYMLRVKGQDGLYKVELMYDGCLSHSVEHIH